MVNIGCCLEWGRDSILSIQIIFKAKQAGLQLTAKQIFQNQSIAELAAATNLAQTVKAEQGLVTGLFPLTPIQHWLGTLEHEDADC